MTKAEYIKNHQNRQISKSVGDLKNSSVRPFTLLSFLSQEGGGKSKDLFHKLMKDFMNEEFADLKTALDSGEFSEEAIAEFRENITEKLLENLGPLRVLAIDIPLLSDLENAAADAILGDEVEAARAFVADLDLPENLFENTCEAF